MLVVEVTSGCQWAESRGQFGKQIDSQQGHWNFEGQWPVGYGSERTTSCWLEGWNDVWFLTQNHGLPSKRLSSLSTSLLLLKYRRGWDKSKYGQWNLLQCLGKWLPLLKEENIFLMFFFACFWWIMYQTCFLFHTLLRMFDVTLLIYLGLRLERSQVKIF